VFDDVAADDQVRRRAVQGLFLVEKPAIDPRAGRSAALFAPPGGIEAEQAGRRADRRGLGQIVEEIRLAAADFDDGRGLAAFDQQAAAARFCRYTSKAGDSDWRFS
jgi:hypothetical protein